MARSGNFGRTPRAAPSLTNTLIAIAREQQQTEDQNIMSAWQKGGVVNGKKVTDEMVLAHWRNRLKDISKDDPLFESYSNLIQQYEYSIAESKMTAQYALIADPQASDDVRMSQFYLNWAKRVPKDSEFYRVLQRDAGQYIRAAKAKRDQKTRINEEKVYNAEMLAMERKNELPGQMALKVITMLAQEGGVIAESPLGAETNIANSTNLEQVALPGIDQMLALLGSVTPLVRDGPKGREVVTAAANNQVLYTGEDGQPVTGATISAMFANVDPTFDGRFSLPYIRDLINSQRDGLQKRIDKANATGHVSDMVQLMSQQAKVNEYGRQIAAWPIAQEYNDLHAAMQKIISNETLLPDAKVARIEAIRAQMGKLADDPRIAEDTRMQTQLRAEAEGKVGIPSLAEDLTGTRTGTTYETKTAGDIKVVNDHLLLYQEQKELIAAGTHVMTQGSYVDDPVTGGRKFVAVTGGASIGAATMEQINNLPGEGKPVPVMIPNGDGGGATPVYVVPAPIYAKATGLNGDEIGQMNTNAVGSFIKYYVNGKEVTLYGVTDPITKQPSWTHDPPWDKNVVKQGFAQDGAMVVDFSAWAQKQEAAAKALFDAGDPRLIVAAKTGQEFSLNNGFVIRGTQYDDAGNLIPGAVLYDPTKAVNLTDQPRVHAGLGKDPYTDSFSASLVALKTSPDGTKLLKQWQSDPRFQSILEQNARIHAGQTKSINGRGEEIWVGGTPGAYERNLATMNADLYNAANGIDINAHEGVGNFWRGSTFDTPSKAAALTKGQGRFDTELPSDTVVKNATATGTRFANLAMAFEPGTNLFRSPQRKPDGLQIQTGLTIKAPGYTPVQVPKSTTSFVPNTAQTSPVELPTYKPPSVVPNSTGSTYQSTQGGNTSGYKAS